MHYLSACKKRWIILAFIGLMVFGCATRRTMVILVPDNDGHVGKVEVSSKQVSRILDGANQAAIITNNDATPEIRCEMDDSEIEKVFADALAAEPPQPKKFHLYFESGTTRLKSESLALISEILDVIRGRRSLDVGINGHTDRVGDDRFNQELSFQRAIMIQKLLIKAGISPKTVHTTSHGEGNPLIQTPDNVAEPQNRRVEVIIR